MLCPSILHTDNSLAYLATFDAFQPLTNMDTLCDAMVYSNGMALHFSIFKGGTALHVDLSIDIQKKHLCSDNIDITISREAIWDPFDINGSAVLIQWNNELQFAKLTNHCMKETSILFFSYQNVVYYVDISDHSAAKEGFTANSLIRCSSNICDIRAIIGNTLQLFVIAVDKSGLLTILMHDVLLPTPIDSVIESEGHILKFKKYSFRGQVHCFDLNQLLFYINKLPYQQSILTAEDLNICFAVEVPPNDKSRSNLNLIKGDQALLESARKNLQLIRLSSNKITKISNQIKECQKTEGFLNRVSSNNESLIKIQDISICQCCSNKVVRSCSSECVQNGSNTFFLNYHDLAESVEIYGHYVDSSNNSYCFAKTSKSIDIQHILELTTHYTNDLSALDINFKLNLNDTQFFQRNGHAGCDGHTIYKSIIDNTSILRLELDDQNAIKVYSNCYWLPMLFISSEIAKILSSVNESLLRLVGAHKSEQEKEIDTTISNGHRYTEFKLLQCIRQRAELLNNINSKCV
ncbi:hypothetical protein GJ496_009188 [Pomphorhynchus laevis]|nr:hypothetical protein GJ496_009188 [Pomphorhynchus laevis]